MFLKSNILEDTIQYLDGIDKYYPNTDELSLERVFGDLNTFAYARALMNPINGQLFLRLTVGEKDSEGRSTGVVYNVNTEHLTFVRPDRNKLSFADEVLSTGLPKIGFTQREINHLKMIMYLTKRIELV